MLSIDVETAAGVRRGEGPLATASTWRRTRRLDRAGAIAFEVAATDPRAQLVELRSYAHGFGSRAGVRADLGLGIVDTIELDTAARVLSIGGDDLLRELAMRPAGAMTLKNGSGPMPLVDALTLIFSTTNALPVAPWLVNTYGYASTGDTTTGSTTIANVINIANWTGREGSAIFGVGIPAGATVVSVGASSLTISSPATNTAPGVPITRAQVFYQVGDESVLQLLIKLANATGTHFRLGTGREVVWLYDVRPASGIRAVNAASPSASNPDVCHITSLVVLHDSSELISRISPFGAGRASDRLTLADSASDPNRTTRTPPPGYTLDLDHNQLVRPAAETQYGYFHLRRNYQDISPEPAPNVDPTPTSTIAARNQLYDAAFEHLRANSEPQRSYQLDVAKLDREIMPGETIRVVYRDVIAGYTWVDVDADLVVLESTTQVTDAGILTPQLVVAAGDRWPENDQELLARLVREVAEARAHTDA